MMKHAPISFASLFCLVFLGTALSAIGQTTKSALFLGNSYTYFNNLPGLVHQLAKSQGDSLYYDFNTPGGHTLEGHATHPTTLAKIGYPWDHVILQEQSLRAAYLPLNFYRGIRQLSGLIHPDSLCENRILLYQTWGRQNNPTWPYATHQQLTTERYENVGRFFGTEVAPVGIAWKSVRDDNDPVNLYSSDGSHPSYAGSYLAACTFYASLFDQTPVGNSFRGTLDSADAHYLQSKAYTAYLSYKNNGLLHTSTTTDTVYDVQTVALTDYPQNMQAAVQRCCLNFNFKHEFYGVRTAPLQHGELVVDIIQNSTWLAADTFNFSLPVSFTNCGYTSTAHNETLDLTPVVEGDFTLQFSLNGVLFDEVDLYMSPVANLPERAPLSFQLLPNPSTGQTSLQLPPTLSSGQLILRDLTGRALLELRVESSNLSSGNLPLDLSFLPSGTYTAELKTDSGSSVQRLIIE